MRRRYALQHLFRDQEPAFVIDAVPAVLAWAPEGSESRGLRFKLAFADRTGAAQTDVAFSIHWRRDELELRDASVLSRAERMRKGQSPHREHLVEVAGYGVAMCAISALLPGRRVVGWSRYAAPDILFDATPDALRGVEVAARSGGGLSKLRELDAQKRPGLVDDPAVAEAWLSLWIAQPALGWFFQVKP